MIPKEYELFCKMQRVEGCSYLYSIDCPKTCNLSKQAELEDNIDSEFNDVFKEELKKLIKIKNYERWNN